jgi:hypothetical protein
LRFLVSFFDEGRGRRREMAGGFSGGDAVSGRAAQYEGRITSYFILACIVGSFGGSLFGYDLGVSSEYSDSTRRSSSLPSSSSRQFLLFE